MVSQSKGAEQSDNRKANKVDGTASTVLALRESDTCFSVFFSLLCLKLAFVSQSCGLMKLPLGLR